MTMLVVYSRQGCHLCEVTIEALLERYRGRVTLDIRDVDDNPEWQQVYGLKVPVIEHDGTVICTFRLDSSAVEAVLGSHG